MMRFINDDHVEKVAVEQRQPALHLLDVGNNHISPQTVLPIRLTALEHDESRQVVDVSKHTAFQVEIIRG